jgi:carbamoyl-phosphate synthase/aspartate carbamoyltransferase/dihydroorotase
VGELCETPSHWRHKKTLSQWLSDNDVPGICGIDTRELTKKIRKKGTILGRIVMGVPSSPPTEFQDPNKRNLVSEVSIKVQAVLFLCVILPQGFWCHNFPPFIGDT